MAKYICKNFGACGKADAKEEIDVLPGTDAKCPECGASLHEVAKARAKAGSAGVPRGAIVAVVAAVLVLGAAGGGYLWWQAKQKDLAEAAASKAGDVLGPIASSVVAAGVQALKDGLEDRAGSAGAPAETELAKLKEAGEAALLGGETQAAAEASRRAAAMEMIKTAISYLSKGDLARAEQELQAAAERAPGEPLVDYNLAVVRIKQKRIDEAIKLLDESFNKGFRAVDAMERDPDLAPLRGDARYQALVSKYRKG